jgi:hypothetical protein
MSAVLATMACGHVPERIGVLVNEAHVVKSRIPAATGDGAPNLPQSGPPSNHQLNVGQSTRPFVLADRHTGVEPGWIHERPRGEGLDILDSGGRHLHTLKPPEYLTDFGTIASSNDDRELVVVYGYPNAESGGTFRVCNADFTEIASWAEYPPPGGFSVGEWHNAPALFYLQNDTLVVRSALGRLLERRRIPGANIFQRVVVNTLSASQTILVATGSGYTPFSMVCLYDRDRLVFQEVLPGRARGLLPGSGTNVFVVLMDDGRWKYQMG